MTDKEFMNYIYESRRQGLDNGQIAAKLGMSTEELKDILENGKTVIKSEPARVPEKEEKKPVKEKPVSGAGAVKPATKDPEDIFFVPQSD